MQKAGQDVRVYVKMLLVMDTYTKVSPMVLRVVDVSPFRASSGKEVRCLAQAESSKEESSGRYAYIREGLGDY